MHTAVLVLEVFGGAFLAMCVVVLIALALRRLFR
jgi:hypothetical protein